MPARSTTPDPFSSITSPPPNETAEEKDARMLREAEARRVSHSIDEEIKEARAVMKRREKEVIKVLLLGQAESGKSTTLKNFRMKYARDAWKAERSSWRAVVLLNVVKVMLNVVNALILRLPPPSEQQTQSPPTSSPQSPIIASSPDTHTHVPGSPTAVLDSLEMSSNYQHPASLSTSPNLTHSRSHPLFELTPTHSRLIETLYEPLLGLERELKEHLGPASEEVGEFGYLPPSSAGHGAAQQHMQMQSATPFDPPVSVPSASSPDAATVSTHARSSISSLSRSAAREAVEKRRIASGFLVRSWPSSSSSANANGSHPATYGTPLDLDKVSAALTPLVDDMSTLWEDPTVKELVRKRKIRVEDGVEFFLTDLARITAPTYVPTDDDVVRCRLRTTGVTEYPLYFHTDVQDRVVEDNEDEEGAQRGSKFPKISFGKEWVMYDVGGARTNRYAWQPYFENVHSIIFLAPISCFDERLLEDTRINRLEDSFLLWKSIVSSQFFVKTTMVVFLNKVDILKKKLENGLVINKYLPSFGPRDNDLKTVVKYLRDKFREMSKQYSPFARVVYLYTTSVIDTKATAQTLKSVRDGILREHLMSAELA